MKIFKYFVLLLSSLTILQSCGIRHLSDCQTREDYDYYIKHNRRDEVGFLAVRKIAKPYVEKKEWDSAVAVYTKYKPLFNLDKKFDYQIALMQQSTPDVILTKLPKVNKQFTFKELLDYYQNSAIPEKKDYYKTLLRYKEKGIYSDTSVMHFSYYTPVISSDGKKLYMCSNGRPDGFGGEDIFVSEFDGKEWQEPKNFGAPINTQSQEAPTGISTDGNTLVIFGNYQIQSKLELIFSRTTGEGDLFFCEKTKDGWSEVKNFPSPINSFLYEADGSFTPDGKGFIFVSTRSNAKQGLYNEELWQNHYNTDIYICFRKDSTWSMPINLGPTINTIYSERSPYLSPDGKTLFFSSDGRGGFGGYDVFKSVRLSDASWTEWSEPENLGKGINSADDDWGYSISAFGDKAYFAKKDSGVYSIYSITLPKKAQPELAVVTISGKVTDETGKMLESEIKWEDVETGSNIGILKSDPQTGEYFIALPVGKNYSYYAEKDGYYPVSKNLDLKHAKTNDKINVDISLITKNKIESGASILINNLFFDYNKSQLKNESIPELRRLVNLFKDNDKWKVEISAYTDSKGGDEYNLNLSQARAEAVVTFLIDKGIAKERIVAKGYGKENPVATNDSEEGRMQNRRVEFKLLK